MPTSALAQWPDFSTVRYYKMQLTPGGDVGIAPYAAVFYT